MFRIFGTLTFFGLPSKFKPHVYAAVGGIAVLAIAVFVIVYHKGAFDKDRDLQPLILEAPITKDSVFVKDTVQLPPSIEVVEALATEETHVSRVKADRVITERSGVEVETQEVATPLEKTIDQSLDILHLEARPLDSEVAIDLTLHPIELEKVGTTGRTTSLKSQRFWKKPFFFAAGAAAVGAGAAFILLSTKEEAEPAVTVELPKPPGRP